MEFAVVNNYMGPVATKAMKGYSDEDLREAIDDFKVKREKARCDICGERSTGSAKLIVRDKVKCAAPSAESNAISSCRCDIAQLNKNF